MRLIFLIAAREVEDENIIMYVGLIVAIAVFITVVIIIIFLLRRKTQRNGVYDYCKPLQGASTAHEKQIHPVNLNNFIPKFIPYHFISNNIFYFLYIHVFVDANKFNCVFIISHLHVDPSVQKSVIIMHVKHILVLKKNQETLNSDLIILMNAILEHLFRTFIQ